jgi:UDP-N-acetylglucosamine:LPS N-acetylglucosamine transferase
MKGSETQPEVRVLALSSGGGHWVQLMRLKPAWEGMSVMYATVTSDAEEDVAGAKFCTIPDANRWHRFRLLWMAIKVTAIVIRWRPNAVVTTGAAPGLIALIVGHLLGARTVWVDSIANTKVMSLSGRMARRVSDVWLTQWPHLASEDGPHWRGAVL